MSEAVAAVSESPYRDIILAAVNAAGPIPMDEAGNPDKAAWDRNVAENAVNISVLTSTHSPIAKRLAMLQTCKKFPATVLGVKKESNTTRGFIVMKTKVTDHSPDGIEIARTERTDASVENALFAKRLQGLKGHRVLVWIDMQTMASNNRKVRVIQHVEDLGEDSEYNAEEAEAITTAKFNR